MSSPRLPQASSDQIYTVLCGPRPPATLSRRPLVPDPLFLVPGLLRPLVPLQNKNRLSRSGDASGHLVGSGLNPGLVGS